MHREPNSLYFGLGEGAGYCNCLDFQVPTVIAFKALTLTQFNYLVRFGGSGTRHRSPRYGSPRHPVVKPLAGGLDVGTLLAKPPSTEAEASRACGKLSPRDFLLGPILWARTLLEGILSLCPRWQPDVTGPLRLQGPKLAVSMKLHTNPKSTPLNSSGVGSTPGSASAFPWKARWACLNQVLARYTVGDSLHVCVCAVPIYIQLPPVASLLLLLLSSFLLLLLSSSSLWRQHMYIYIYICTTDFFVYVHFVDYQIPQNQSHNYFRTRPIHQLLDLKFQEASGFGSLGLQDTADDVTPA